MIWYETLSICVWNNIQMQKQNIYLPALQIFSRDNKQTPWISAFWRWVSMHNRITSIQHISCRVSRPFAEWKVCFFIFYIRLFQYTLKFILKLVCLSLTTFLTFLAAIWRSKCIFAHFSSNYIFPWMSLAFVFGNEEWFSTMACSEGLPWIHFLNKILKVDT